MFVKPHGLQTVVHCGRHDVQSHIRTRRTERMCPGRLSHSPLPPVAILASWYESARISAGYVHAVQMPQKIVFLVLVGGDFHLAHSEEGCSGGGRHASASSAYAFPGNTGGAGGSGSDFPLLSLPYRKLKEHTHNRHRNSIIVPFEASPSLKPHHCSPETRFVPGITKEPKPAATISPASLTM